MPIPPSRDFLEKFWLPVVLALAAFTRIPFLWTGYGSDTDAWLVAKSATVLWNTGTYHESRLPGYPLHELVSAPLIGLGGAPLSNGATLVVTLIAVVVWSRISRLAGRHTKLLVIAFAFAPAVWQHSADTLDYLWSLLFLLLSLSAILRNHLLFAGAALGIAAGFRPSNLAAAVPLLTLVLLQKRDAPRTAVFLLSTFLVSAAAFAPLILRYGIPGWFVATRQEMSDVLTPTFSMRWISFFYRAVYFLGPVSAAIAGYVLWKGKDSIAISLRSREPVIVTSLVGILTFLLLFLWLPLDRAYLLPALPFLLLLIDRLSSQRLFAVFTLFLALSALVTFDVIDPQTRRSFRPNVHSGPVLEELSIRKEMLQERQ
jgi:hypothetical protein